MPTAHPPPPRLPSVASLRVFLEVARLGSTARASETVNLTQSAVSKQVRLLEAALGCDLFDRTRQGLRLSEEGVTFLPYAQAALEQILRGRRLLAERIGTRRPVRLRLPAIVGERWVIPRFPEFQRAHPGIDVQFTNYLSENDAEEPDLDIRHGEGGWPGQVAEYLFGRTIACVRAPASGRSGGGPLSFEDVAKGVLLQHFQAPAYWAEFAAAHGSSGATPAHSIRYGYHSIIIRAAIAGQGFALLPRDLIVEELADGRLVEEPMLGFESAAGYWLTWSAETEPSAEAAALRDWILLAATGAGDL